MQDKEMPIKRLEVGPEGVRLEVIIHFPEDSIRLDVIDMQLIPTYFLRDKSSLQILTDPKRVRLGFSLTKISS